MAARKKTRKRTRKRGAKRAGERARSWRRWGLRWVLRGFACGLVATLLMVLPWRWIDPPTSAFMLRASWSEGRVVSQQWRDIDRISPQLAIAVVAAEDQKFPVHGGFDVTAIRLALTESKGRLRGASTITQQVAKNLFLWPGRSLVRKGLEAWLTLWIEALWPKHRILEIYLNLAEFGPGVFGAEAASRWAHQKAARSLSLSEAALLAAVLPNPKQLLARAPSPYVRGRAGQIQQATRQLGGPGYLRDL